MLPVLRTRHSSLCIYNTVKEKYKKKLKKKMSILTMSSVIYFLKPCTDDAV